MGNQSPKTPPDIPQMLQLPRKVSWAAAGTGTKGQGPSEGGTQSSQRLPPPQPKPRERKELKSPALEGPKGSKETSLSSVNEEREGGKNSTLGFEAGRGMSPNWAGGPQCHSNPPGTGVAPALLSLQGLGLFPHFFNAKEMYKPKGKCATAHCKLSGQASFPEPGDAVMPQIKERVK